MESIQYDGAWWNLSPEGNRIVRWDGREWVPWYEGAAGPQPPPELVRMLGSWVIPPPPPSAARQSINRERPWLQKRYVIAAAVVGLLVVGGSLLPQEPQPLFNDSAAQGSSNLESEANSDRGADEANDAADALVEPEPSPDGRFTSTCSYLLGNFTESESGYRFVADARLRNTGNIGVIVHVKAIWFLAGGAEAVEEKTVKLPYRANKRIGFVRVASQDEIDQHQSLGYNDNCKVKVNILETFGEPQA